MTLAIIGVFLPLFPLSMLQNFLLTRLRAPLPRAALVLLWPQAGVTLLDTLQPAIPPIVVTWALLSAAFYALRLLTVRDLGLWAGMFASSALALTWGLAAGGATPTELHLFVFWFSLPVALLIMLIGPLTQRFGAAYAGLYAGFSEPLPRLAGVLTVLVLGTIATPPFPGFFALLDLLQSIGAAAAVGVLCIWLMWGWAATRLLQGFVSGTGRAICAADLGSAGLLAYIAAVGVFVAAGWYLSGAGL